MKATEQAFAKALASAQNPIKKQPLIREVVFV